MDYYNIYFQHVCAYTFVLLSFYFSKKKKKKKNTQVVSGLKSSLFFPLTLFLGYLFSFFFFSYLPTAATTGMPPGMSGTCAKGGGGGCAIAGRAEFICPGAPGRSCWSRPLLSTTPGSAA